MNRELICSWLGLPADAWPPDHYLLLGLNPGECDLALIEQRVHQRLDSVRRYQMMHPEQATEAMNRLAQAFVCLTEAATKKAYDQSLRGNVPREAPSPMPVPTPVPAPAPAKTITAASPIVSAVAAQPAPAASPAPMPVPVPVPVPAVGSVAVASSAPASVPAPASAVATVPSQAYAPAVPIVPTQAPASAVAAQPARAPSGLAMPRDPLVWLYTPGQSGPGVETPVPSSVRLPTAPALATPPPAIPLGRATPPPPTQAAPTAPPPPPPPLPPIDTVVESARSSRQARRGLSTKRALYHRVARTRQLLRLWHRIGKHLDNAETRLSKQEAGHLFKLVKEFEDVLDDFPLLGEAGQPGYLIINLTQLDKARALQALTISQRESLQRDWRAGLKFLEAHRDYLRGELRVHRQRGLLERITRAARGYINEDPLAAGLLLLALAALAIAVWRYQ